MTDAVETTIEKALLNRAQAFATANSLTISLPNTDFTPPVVGPTSKYLRATLLPADPATLGVSSEATNQHLGLLQLDVFYGLGGGEIAPIRILDAAAVYFKRGTRIISNGFNIDVLQIPRRGPAVRTDNWIYLPLRIPYTCFANPA